MAIIGPSGRDIPALSTKADATAAFTEYDSSGVPILSASSAAHAEQRVAAYRAAGGEGPVLIWRTDVTQMHTHPNTGAAGETTTFVAGPQGGLAIHLAGTIAPHPAPLTLLTSGIFGESSMGIRWESPWLIFDQGGLFFGKLQAVWKGGNAGLNRTVTTITTSTGEEIARAEAGDNDHPSDVVVQDIAPGTHVKFEAVHQDVNPRWLNVMLKGFFTTGAATEKFL